MVFLLKFDFGYRWASFLKESILHCEGHFISDVYISSKALLKISRYLSLLQATFVGA